MLDWASYCDIFCFSFHVYNLFLTLSSTSKVFDYNAADKKILNETHVQHAKIFNKYMIRIFVFRSADKKVLNKTHVQHTKICNKYMICIFVFRSAIMTTKQHLAK